MSVLTAKTIRAAMANTADPLVVMPLLDSTQIGESSVDLRLGHEFIVLRRSFLPNLNPAQIRDWRTDLFRSQERIRIATHDHFVLHPGDLVLGATLEYVAMPRRVAGAIEGRSSWGRLGLIIATACSIAPGFKGCITLELLHSGTVPLTLHPGVRIAQLVLQRTESEVQYKGKYICPTGPQFSRLEKDAELSYWVGNQGNGGHKAE
jgi:dCTP deaminase